MLCKIPGGFVKWDGIKQQDPPGRPKVKASDIVPSCHFSKNNSKTMYSSTIFPYVISYLQPVSAFCTSLWHIGFLQDIMSTFSLCHHRRRGEKGRGGGRRGRG